MLVFCFCLFFQDWLMCMSILRTGTYVCLMHAWCHGSPGTKVTNSCELPMLLYYAIYNGCAAIVTLWKAPSLNCNVQQTDNIPGKKRQVFFKVYWCLDLWASSPLKAVVFLCTASSEIKTPFWNIQDVPILPWLFPPFLLIQSRLERSLLSVRLSPVS